MRRYLLGALFAVVAIVLMAFTRPGNEFNLLTLLNGESVRWIMADGGMSGMYGSGQTCMPIAQIPAAANGVIEITPMTPVNYCERSTTLVPKWDGGCNMLPTDPNFGIQLQPFVSRFVVLRTTTTHLCQVSDAGTASTPVYAKE